MSDSVREFKESPFEQGIGESAPYVFDTLPWGGTPTSPSYVLEDETSPVANVGTASLTGAGSVSANLLTTPVVHGLIAGHHYRLTCTFTALGRIVTAYAIVHAKR